MATTGAALTAEITATLTRLRTARHIDPKHDARLVNRLGMPVLHVDCDVCTATKRLNYLLDRLPRRTAA